MQSEAEELQGRIKELETAEAERTAQVTRAAGSRIRELESVEPGDGSSGGKAARQDKGAGDGGS